MGRLRRVHHRLSLRAMALLSCLCACPASSAWLACHLCVCMRRAYMCVHAACVHVCAASSRRACLCACVVVVSVCARVPLSSPPVCACTSSCLFVVCFVVFCACARAASSRQRRVVCLCVRAQRQ